MQTGVWCAALWPFPLRHQVVVAVVVSLRVLGEHCGCACMSQGCAISHGSVRTYICLRCGPLAGGCNVRKYVYCIMSSHPYKARLCMH